MDTFLYILFACFYAGLLIMMVQSIKKSGVSIVSNVLILVIVPLIYDNAILGIGKWIGEGEVLENLNAARYWMHAIFTPLLILFSWDVLKRARVKWVNTTSAILITVAFTLIAFLIELFTVVWDLSLKAEKSYGILSYSSTNSPQGPPIMILMVTLALLVSSIILWKRTGWYWIFVGTALMIVGSMVKIPIESGAITNAFELILLISLVFTKRYQDRYQGGKKLALG
ncbi:hypothetical protein [Bacillus sp. FJAT-27986]|uniref:hypothetical protein n=1 Tax=Bacillus sp. FJAT-27986 TaxID=1743146 RepID=UPI00080ADD74|nr:hypothetical protein [Bacillus sp. FJAT-27986]OCA84762.1 hypothetical protein A8L44_10280 [Bacillus sp. FJAT-27986]